MAILRALSLILCLLPLAYSVNECPMLTCEPAPKCEFGAHIGTDGCPTCECRPQMCQTVECAKGRECHEFPLSSTNQNIARCVDPNQPKECQLPMDTGPCRAMMSRHFYDSDADECYEFTYGGCQGNENNYKSRIDCDMACRGDKMGVKPGCSPVMCMMFCEHGFTQDENGCDKCECRAEPQVKVKSGGGCPVSDECELFCSSGYKFDISGCEVCECNQPSTCPVPECENSQQDCKFGHAVTEEGCETCECKTEESCKNIQCNMYCQYGHITDRYGCQACQCKTDPCMFTACPDDTTCVAKNTSKGWNTDCVMSDSWDGKCPEYMCMKYCEHGFKKDKFGCDVCECLASMPPACPINKCEPCEFGYSFTEDGCTTCQCLENPCQRYECSDNTVCVTKKACYGEKSCNYSPRCITGNEVKRVHVHVDYVTSDATPELQEEEFVKVLEEHYKTLVAVDEVSVQEIKISLADEKTVKVDFHLVEITDTPTMNLVDVSESFKKKIVHHDEGSAPRYAETDFIPQAQSFISEYSSDRALPQQYGSSEGEASSGTVVVVAACIGGAVVLIIVIVVAVAIIKSKRREKSPSSPRKNIIYKPTLNDYKNEEMVA